MSWFFKGGPWLVSNYYTLASHWSTALFFFQWGEGEITAVVAVAIAPLPIDLTDLLTDHMAAAAALPTDHMAAAAAALTTEEGGNWDSVTRLLTLWNLFSNPSHVVSLCSLRCSSLKARRFWLCYFKHTYNYNWLWCLKAYDTVPLTTLHTRFFCAWLIYKKKSREKERNNVLFIKGFLSL